MEAFSQALGSELMKTALPRGQRNDHLDTGLRPVFF